MSQSAQATYLASAPSLTDQQVTPLLVDSSGNLKVNIATGSVTVTGGTLGNNVDSVAAVATGNTGSDSYTYCYDRVNSVWSRATLNPNNMATNTVPAANSVNNIFTSSITLGVSGNNFIGVTAQQAPGNGITDNTVRLATGAFGLVHNGTSWDYRTGNVNASATLVTLSNQAAGTVNSADLTNGNCTGIKVGVNVTAATGTVQVTIQGKDTVSGQYYTILQSTASASTGFTVLTVHPGITATANVSAADVLPRTYRVSVTVGTGGGVTATIGSCLII